MLILFVKHRIRLAIIAGITLLSIHATAQNTSSIVIQGYVYDHETQNPLHYANIQLKGSNIGTVTNSKGEFKLSVPSFHAHDSVRISYVGFQMQTLAVSSLVANTRIYLKEEQEILTEITVTEQSALSIVTTALRKIGDNYFTQPYNSTGFYRVTSKRDTRYMHLSEAVFELHNAKKESQFKLVKMRAIKDEKASHGLDLGLKPGGVIEMDVVHHPGELSFLKERELKDYVFQLEDQSTYMDQEVYVISFDQADGLKKAGYKGWLYIDVGSYAIVYLDVALSPKGVQYYKFGDAAQRTLMNIMDIHIDMLDNRYQISYTRRGDRYYLSTVGNDAVLSFRSSRYHYNFLADTRVDYVVTDMNFDNVIQFTNQETLGNSKLIEEQDSPYDKTFWDDYNIILPDADFISIAKIIKANNKANDTRTEIENKLNKYPKEKAVRIDSILSFYNRKDLFNGNALIEYNGKVILEKSFNHVLTHNTLNTPFRIGSTSKTFTSMLILQLENAGLLQVNDPVKKYLPDYRHGDITIEQLLTHQSGIPNYLAKNEYVAQLFEKEYSTRDLINLFCSDSLEFEPGSKFQYSNSGYVVLSGIIEAVTGKSYGQVLKEKILGPLQMSDTYSGRPADTTNLAKGFMYGKPEPIYFAQNVVGAGGITSTANDLLKWSHALDEAKLLPQSKMNLLYVPRAAYTDWDADYGYGWMLDKYMFRASKGHAIRYHPGTDFGFYTMFLKQPDEKITIILLNNTGDFPRFEISDLILDTLN